MPADLEQQAKELFRQAAVLPAAQRDKFLRERCADEQVRRRAEQLLEHDGIAGSAFLRGATHPGDSSVEPWTHPQQIGRFRILSVLGHGGMGTVYEAEQDKPHRKVALKVIRPGWMSRAMLRRFEYEAEVLARLDHPGIARIYDAGTADTGHGPQPYFAMELVRGQRLDAYVRETNPSMKDRLKLLIEICQAVHHAHTKGVIHRDLKPSNIIITEEGRPKILDFGVARATDSDIQSTTLHTESGQIIGTLPYMAPEQAAGKVSELDTSSDVYALGVIAYELLSGTMPYSLEGKALHEAVRVICEDEPSRLSNINKNLRGDVETIVGKALEKDKTRRYHTAGELAADVKRYLDYEPITARPPGTWYQVSRFARRNKLVVASVALVLIAFAGATVISTWQAVVARSEERRADEQAEIAKAVNEFFNRDVLSQASVEGQDKGPAPADRNLTVREALDRAAVRIDERFEKKPLVEAAIRTTIGFAYLQMGDYSKSDQHLAEALRLARQSHADERMMLDCMSSLSELYIEQARYDEAEPLLQEILQMQRRVPGAPGNPYTTLSHLGLLYLHQGNFEKAEPLLLEVSKWQRKTLGEEHRNTLTVRTNLAMMYHFQGRYAEAEPILQDVLAISRKVDGDDHHRTLWMLDCLGQVYIEQRQVDKAEPLMREALEGRGRVLGDEHPETVSGMHNLGALYLRKKDFEKAEPLLLECLPRYRRIFGDQHPMTLMSIFDLGQLYGHKSQFDRALPYYAEAYQAAPSAPLDPDQMALCVSGYGVCLVKLSRYAEAETPLREACNRLKSTKKSNLAWLSAVVSGLVDVCSATNRPDEAAKWRAELAALQAATQPATQPASQPPDESAQSQP